MMLANAKSAKALIVTDGSMNVQEKDICRRLASELAGVEGVRVRTSPGILSGRCSCFRDSPALADLPGERIGLHRQRSYITIDVTH